MKGFKSEGSALVKVEKNEIEEHQWMYKVLRYIETENLKFTMDNCKMRPFTQTSLFFYLKT